MAPAKRAPRVESLGLERMPTGISGFDDLLGGGLPRDRTTLVLGSPGCGKTLFALQTLVNGARRFDEPGIFVAFEESTRNLIANSASFDWNVERLSKKGIFFLDARLPHAVIRGGEFDLLGLLAAVSAKQAQTGARRVVFDGIDILLTLLDDPLSERREMHRLTEWLSDRNLTGLVTCKSEEGGGSVSRGGYLQSLTDCVINLQNKLVGNHPVRLMRVAKCRGLAHATGEVPFAITASGLKVISYAPAVQNAPAQKISTGIDSLDGMLAGGYLRGSSVLISGSPGTAKSTLAGVFIAAAARRREHCLYVSFDEAAGQVVRNLAAVGVRLGPHVKSGLLRVASERKVEKNAVEHVARIIEQIETHDVKCLVVDPISALASPGFGSMAEELVVRLLDYARSRQVTVVCTCTRASTLLGTGDGLVEDSAAGVSSIADTWIHLSNLALDGNRQRALTIVKARGIGHSNQIRALRLTSRGINLGDFLQPGASA